MKARIFLIIVFPFILLWAIIHRLAYEARHGAYMVWLDIRLEVDSAKGVWRSGRLDRKDGDA